LHKHRKKISRKSFRKKTTKNFKITRKVCSVCQAESIFIDKNGNKTCKNCEKTSKNHPKLQIEKKGIKCPSCDSTNYEKKGFRKEKQRYVCKDCRKNWTSDVIVKNRTTKKTKSENTFQRENSLKEIIAYLKSKEKNNMPLKFWYRNDIEPRKMYDYFVDDRYVQVRSDKGYYIKFLIDKIRKVEE